MVSFPMIDMLKIAGKEVNIRSFMAGENSRFGWQPNLKIEDYHADKSALNSSSLKLMDKSAYSFARNYWVKTKPPTNAMRFGTLVHMAILEPLKFKKHYQVQPQFVGLTQDGRETTRANSLDVMRQYEEWRSELPAGAVIVTKDEQDKIFGMIDSVLSHPTASVLLSNIKPEIIGYWQKELATEEELDADPNSSFVINMRMAIDGLAFNMGNLSDLKTCQDCSMKSFRKTHIEGLQAFHQIAMYEDGANHIEKYLIENKTWIAVESEWPHETAVHEVSEEYELAGKWLYNQNLQKIKKCIKNREFPYAQEEPMKVIPSGYFLQKYQELGAF